MIPKVAERTWAEGDRGGEPACHVHALQEKKVSSPETAAPCSTALFETQKETYFIWWRKSTEATQIVSKIYQTGPMPTVGGFPVEWELGSCGALNSAEIQREGLRSSQLVGLAEVQANYSYISKVKRDTADIWVTFIIPVFQEDGRINYGGAE